MQSSQRMGLLPDPSSYPRPNAFARQHPPALMQLPNHYIPPQRRNHLSHQQPHHNNRPRPNNQRPRTDNFKVAAKLIDDNNTQTTKEILLRTLVKQKVWANNVVPIEKGFLIITDKPANVDQLMSEATAKALSEINLRVVMPRDLMHKRTLFVTGVDESLGGRPAEDIKAEILRLQTNLNIEKVAKLGSKTKMFIIHCKDTDTVTNLLTNGFRAFCVSVAPYQITPKRVTDIKMCFKCYAFDSHYTKECKSKRKVCSNCAEEGHAHYENRCAPGQKNKCVNCKSRGKRYDHHTLSSRCPTKKELLNRKENKQQPQQHQTLQPQQPSYATAAAVTPPSTANAGPPPINEILGVNHEEAVKVLTVVVDASMKAMFEPTSYSKIVEKGIKENLKVDVKVDNHLKAHAGFKTMVEEIVRTRIYEMYPVENASQSPPHSNPAMQSDALAAPPAFSHHRDEDMSTSTSSADSDSEINEAAQSPPQLNPATQTDIPAASPVSAHHSDEDMNTSTSSTDSDSTEPLTDSDSEEAEDPLPSLESTPITQSHPSDSTEPTPDTESTKSNCTPSFPEPATPTTPPTLSVKRKMEPSPELNKNETQRTLIEKVTHTPKKVKYLPATKRASNQEEGTPAFHSQAQS